MKLMIIDPVPHARSVLRQLCATVHDVEIVGEADCGRAAINAAHELNPELLLLDALLPDMSGFDVLRVMRNELGTCAIIVTDRPDHAVAAYAAGAVDYLLKPVAAARLAMSLDRARTRSDAAASPYGRYPGSSRPEILVGEKDRRLYPLEPRQINYVESDGNYVMFRTASAGYISRDSIKRLALLLAEEGFLRIERSLLLNMRAVAFVEPGGHGTYAFTLTSGTVLQSSATHRDEILKRMPLVRTNKATCSMGYSFRI